MTLSDWTAVWGTALGPLRMDKKHWAIDWVIVGGESGPRARPMKLEWVRAIREDCRERGTAFFFKQTGAVLARELGLVDRAGADPTEWPRSLADLTVREFPR